MPTRLSPALSDVVARLDRYPQVRAATVFGSAVAHPGRARDIDLAFCMNRTHSDRMLRRLHPLLSVASYGTTRYGLMDLFVQFSNQLWVRDEDCKQFVPAKNSKALGRAIALEGMPWVRWRETVELDPSVPAAPPVPRTVYFAHPKSAYGTAEEKYAISTLEAAGMEVLNPNQPRLQAQCGKDIANWQALAAGCDAVAALPFPDGTVGAGVGAEVEAARAAGKPVYLMDWRGQAFWPVLRWPGALVLLSLEETRARLQQAREIEDAHRAEVLGPRALIVPR